jgi:hypothetical protein
MPPEGTSFGPGITCEDIRRHYNRHCNNRQANSTFTVDFESLSLDLSSNTVSPPPKNEEELKEWVWNNYKDQILSGMSIRWENNERINHHHENDTTSCGSMLSDKQLELLERVAHAQRKYLQSEGPMAVYSCLLEGLLDMMGSEFGFIGEARYNAAGKMYLHIHVSTDISWDEKTKRFYEEHHKKGLDFYKLDNLFGHVLTSKAVVLANDAASHPNATGLPPGHPDVRRFLGVPILAEGGELLVSQWGLHQGRFYKLRLDLRCSRFLCVAVLGNVCDCKQTKWLHSKRYQVSRTLY